MSIFVEPVTKFLHKQLDGHLGRSNRRSQKKFEKKVLGAGNILQQKLAAGESFGTAFLKDSISRGKHFEVRGEKLRTKQEAAISNVGGQLNRVRAAANSGVQQKTSAPQGGPRGFSRALEMNLRRGKARQGVENRGEKAILNQQLKDRLQLAKGTLGKRGTMQQSSADAARLRAGGDAAAQRANSQVGAAFAGATGAIIGGALRGFGDSFGGDKTLEDGMMSQQGDVDSFFGAAPGMGGVDNTFDGGGFDFTGGGGTVFG